MKLVRSALLGAFLSVMLFSAPAFALSGYTTADVNMRTGPGIRYARVTVIPARSLVNIRECLPDLYWCRVYWRGFRGWVSRHYLRYGEYRPRSYGPPIIYFEHRDRRWHDDHDRWHKRRIYPKQKKKSDRRKWNRDHDRWHDESTKKNRAKRRRKTERNVKERRPKSTAKKQRKPRIERDRRSEPKSSRRRKCPPGQGDCD